MVGENEAWYKTCTYTDIPIAINSILVVFQNVDTGVSRESALGAPAPPCASVSTYKKLAQKEKHAI